MNKLTKYALFLVLISTLSINSVAQNLVPNPSLENFVSCPGGISEIPFPSEAAISVSNWSRATSATSDYHNSCAAVATLVNTPSNFAGYQPPKEGEAYGGVYCYMTGSVDFDYREYLQSQLSTPLIAGHHYFVSYYTSLADEIGSLIALDQMGAYFSTTPEERDAEVEAMDDLIPQVATPFGLLLNDTLNWMHVSGTFTAAGGEEWMIVGNFTPADDLSIEPVGPPEDFSIGYYYFDDFCVLDISVASVTSSIDTGFCPGTEILIEGRDGYSSYVWDDGTTTQQRAITEAGSYWVTSLDLTTCTSRTDTIHAVGVIQTIEIDLGNDTTVCKDVPVELNAFSEEFTEYRWNTGEDSSGILAFYPGIYYVSASSDCKIGADTIVINSPSIPLVELPNDIILCDGKELPVGIAMGNLQYQWNTGQDVCCINITESGTYMLTATNICGESDSDDIKVDYSGCDNCILSPTAFSPNGDGLNDQFEVHVNCLMREYKLSIFNRWGQLVFSTVKPDKHWDGFINGKPADVGVYFYYIEATPAILDLEKIVKKGDVTLVR